MNVFDDMISDWRSLKPPMRAGDLLDSLDQVEAK